MQPVTPETLPMRAYEMRFFAASGLAIKACAQHGRRASAAAGWHEAWPHEAAAVVDLHVSHGFRNSEASCRTIRTPF